jgi:hypothetical protein
MAGQRLEHWSTLNREELKRRVEQEIRRDKLSIVEQQLLEAAQGRLRSWKEPSMRSSMLDDEPKDDPAPSKEPDPTKESKVKRNTSKVRSGKKRTAAKATKAVKGSARKSVGSRTRLDPTAKVMKGTGTNPFREGTGAYERTQIVLKSIGQTVETVSNKKGLKSSTLANLKRKGVIKVG